VADKQEKIVFVLVCVFAAVPVVLGCLTLIAWVMERLFLASFNPAYIPMAPNTALSFILLSAALCIAACSVSWKNRVAGSMLAAVLVVAAVRLFELWAGVEVGIDRLFISAVNGSLGGIPIGQMAFVTAVSFIFSAVAIAFSIKEPNKSISIWVPVAFAGFVFSVSAMILLGYLYGRPLGYGGTAIPMALTTAIAFVALSAGVLCLIAGRQVIERREAIEKLRAAEDVLREENRQLKDIEKTKTLFLSMVSHELRTPLVPMRLGIQMLLERTRSARDRETLGVVLRNLLRLNKLINDLLDVTRIDAKRLTITVSEQSLENIVREVIALEKQSALENKIRLSCQVARLPLLKLDKDRITQVLINLINNAIKHSGTREILVTAKESAGEVVVSVSDKGRGIVEGDMSRLFTPFFSITKPYGGKGAGLGLCVCKGIVEAHGGRIWAESKLNEGTVFSFALPLNRKEGVA